MKQLLLLLLCTAAINATTYKSFQYELSNSIHIHPFFALGFPAEYYLAELDYLRKLKTNKTGHFSLLTRLRIKQDDFLYYEPVENDGKITSGEIELAARQTFVWAQGKKVQFGGYIQAAQSHGIQQYYVKYRHQIGGSSSHEWIVDSTETMRGYIGTASIAPGVTLQIRRIVLSNDISIGMRFNTMEIPDQDIAFWFKPNFTVGLVF